ncbi:MAG: hypothetical protein V3T17_06545 [Pseudomonadales bacterium]
MLAEAHKSIEELKQQLHKNTNEIALLIDPQCIEQPSHEDLLLIIASYCQEFVTKCEHVELLESKLNSVTEHVEFQTRIGC